jgi:hypothetical protein
MRWFKIRKAPIPPEIRKQLEQYGVAIVQSLATGSNAGLSVGGNQPIYHLPQILGWLTEQYDRAERKETWSITMEVAITVFVLSELLLSLISLLKGR